MKSVRRLRVKWFVLMMSIVTIGTGSAQAEPGPFENFFHRLRRALGEPEHKSPRRSSRKQTDETTNPSTEASPTPAATGDASDLKKRRRFAIWNSGPGQDRFCHKSVLTPERLHRRAGFCSRHAGERSLHWQDFSDALTRQRSEVRGQKSAACRNISSSAPAEIPTAIAAEWGGSRSPIYKNGRSIAPGWTSVRWIFRCATRTNVISINQR